ncbi:hypothetical protein HYT04_01495 [Candidatus Kaiserbacteria bacterium]|nr:hypothetical protein [Candidatus Kaiserbacteria bacterium]
MSKPSILMLIGILTIIVPFSGLPASARAFMTVVLGAIAFGIGLSLRTRSE